MHRKSEPTLTDWNWAVLMLTQAMIGAVSANFRLVELAFEDSSWVVRVTLRKESRTDREWIDEICDDFCNDLADIVDRISPIAYVQAIPDIIISQDPIFLSPESSSRYVFRMREN